MDRCVTSCQMQRFTEGATSTPAPHTLSLSPSLSLVSRSLFVLPFFHHLFFFFSFVAVSLAVSFVLLDVLFRFNILRGNSSFSFDFLRKPRSFDLWKYVQAGDSHDQSVMEGLMLGCMQLVLASILIFLNRMSFTARVVAPPGAPRSNKDRAVGGAKWLINCIYSPVIWSTLFFRQPTTPAKLAIINGGDHINLLRATRDG
jgi:hypothetical protein